MHIVQRGNNRSASFRSARDRRVYLLVLFEALRRSRCLLHTYALMRNHVHLLLTPTDGRGPSRLMQRVGRRYVRYFNRRYGRTGTLWEGRFRSSLVDSERYFLTCSRYIELNPVRAGIVSAPELFRWSSYRHNALGEDDRLITPHALYRALGERDEIRRAAYRALFRHAIPECELQSIRRAVRSGTVLRGERLGPALEPALRRIILPELEHGGDRRSASFRERRERLRSRTLTP